MKISSELFSLILLTLIILVWAVIVGLLL